jgi:hypothetical protein
MEYIAFFAQEKKVAEKNEKVCEKCLRLGEANGYTEIGKRA